MPLSQRLRLRAVARPLAGPVLKFGGQPAWVAAPQWPLSRATGKPMQFIGQIPLVPPVFTGAGGAMAYVFMTDDDDGDDGDSVDGTWEADGGENAVIVQPGGIYPGPTAAMATGPTLYRMVARAGHDLLQPEPVELAVDLSPVADEPAFVAEETRQAWSDQQLDDYTEALEGDKIGGTPLFIQYPEFPPDDAQGWKLLLQLGDGNDFYVNFGDAGVAYVFVDAAETQGKMLWQCG